MSILAVAQSPPVPAPIIGKLTLNGQGLDGYVIEVKNTRTGNTISGNTVDSLVTEHGGFTVDLSKVGFIGPSQVSTSGSGSSGQSEISEISVPSRQT